MIQIPESQLRGEEHGMQTKAVHCGDEEAIAVGGAHPLVQRGQEVRTRFIQSSSPTHRAVPSTFQGGLLSSAKSYWKYFHVHK